MPIRSIPSTPKGSAWGAVLLAIAGLISLWLQARLQPVPTPSIAELRTEGSFGYVRVRGTIIEPPRWNPEGPQLLFRLSDGPTDLSVLAFGPVAAELQRRGRIPRTGDTVTVEGRVREGTDSVRLELITPDGIAIERPDPLPLPIGALATASVGTRVHITGQIRSIRRPYAGLTLIRLQDETGAIDVAWYETLVAERPELPIGAGLQITGALGLYRETLQVVLDDPEGWAFRPWAFTPRPIAHARSLPDRTWVGVEGLLQSLSGGRWVLTDPTGELLVGISSQLRAALTATPPPGTRLRVWGQLRRIDGEPVLFPELSVDLRWEPSHVPIAPPSPTPLPAPAISPSLSLTPSPTPRPRPTSTPFPIAELRSQPPGTLLTVEGTVADLRGFSAGWVMFLEQSGGRLRIFIPTEQMAQIPGREGLYPGALIRATGVLTLYRGELELLPRGGRDIIVRRGVRPDAPLRTVASLNPGDQGARVRIVGQVLEVEPFSAGLRLRVGDGSGAIPVILWENVAAGIPERLKSKGASVEVIGQVRIYRGELQVIPTVPWEVRSP